MQNTIDYNAFEMSGSTYNFNITDYTSAGLNKIRSYLNTLDNSYFVYLKVEENTKIEKVCYDYYNNTNYYDLILLLNNKEMVYDMPYSYDIILEAIEKDIDRYRSKVFKNTFEKFSDMAYNDLENSLSEKYNKNNSKFLYIKAIKINLIPIVLSEIYKLAAEYRDNINLVNME